MGWLEPERDSVVSHKEVEWGGPEPRTAGVTWRAGEHTRETCRLMWFSCKNRAWTFDTS